MICEVNQLYWKIIFLNYRSKNKSIYMNLLKKHCIYFTKLDYLSRIVMRVKHPINCNANRGIKSVVCCFFPERLFLSYRMLKPYRSRSWRPTNLTIPRIRWAMRDELIRSLWKWVAYLYNVAIILLVKIECFF